MKFSKFSSHTDPQKNNFCSFSVPSFVILGNQVVSFAFPLSFSTWVLSLFTGTASTDNLKKIKKVRKKKGSRKTNFFFYLFTSYYSILELDMNSPNWWFFTKSRDFDQVSWWLCIKNSLKNAREKDDLYSKSLEIVETWKCFWKYA